MLGEPKSFSSSERVDLTNGGMEILEIRVGLHP